MPFTKMLIHGFTWYPIFAPPSNARYELSNPFAGWPGLVRVVHLHVHDSGADVEHERDGL